MIPLVHGTQPMKRSTPRSTQSICLPDTRWRKTLLQTQSDVIPPIQFVRKTHWWINLTVHLCPFGKADPFAQLYCTNIHQYTYTFYNQYSSFYFILISELYLKQVCILRLSCLFSTQDSYQYKLILPINSIQFIDKHHT